MVRRGRPEQLERAGVRPGPSVDRLGDQLADGRLDQRVAVAGRRELGGDVVAKHDLAVVVDDHDAVGDGAQRPLDARRIARSSRPGRGPWCEPLRSGGWRDRRPAFDEATIGSARTSASSSSSASPSRSAEPRPRRRRARATACGRRAHRVAPARPARRAVRRAASRDRSRPSSDPRTRPMTAITRSRRSRTTLGGHRRDHHDGR